MTFGSLFAGIGGLDLGLERAGMTCKWQVEIDDYATRVLERHWPNVRRWRDVTTFPPDSECDTLWDEPGRCGGASGTSAAKSQYDGELWHVDLICGGFPCQDISYAGKGAGLGGERSGLFYEAARIIRILGPRYVLLENVSALLTRGIDAVLGTLASLGYDAEWHCIPAAAVGAPHIRDRVFVIGSRSRNTYGSNDNQVSKGSEQNTESQRVGYREASIQGANVANAKCGGGRMHTRPPQEKKAKIQGRREQFQSGLEAGGCRTNGGAGGWSTEPDVGRVANGVPSRVDRLRCLGNAVVPQVAEMVGRMIVESENRG